MSDLLPIQPEIARALISEVSEPTLLKRMSDHQPTRPELLVPRVVHMSNVEGPFYQGRKRLC
jgi:hypothetical protein